MDDNVVKTCVVCNTEKNIDMIFIIKIENVNSVLLKWFQNDIITINIGYYNNK